MQETAYFFQAQKALTQQNSTMNSNLHKKQGEYLSR